MEIQSNELRIGNIVGRYSNIMEVSGLGNERADLILLQPNTRVSWCMLYSDLSGIPLSEEILLKAGFEKYGIWFRINNFNISIGHNIAFEKWVTPYKSPRYLHQLQNLYFALTGQELNTSGLI